MVLSAKNS